MATNFHEIRFAESITYGSVVTLTRRVDIMTLGSGFEERNSPWEKTKRRFDIGPGIKDFDDAQEVQSFFEAREGPLYGFRFKDRSDWKSTKPLSVITPVDMLIGIGDGSTVRFQLIKAYASGNQGFFRWITKPVSGTTVVAKNRVTVSSGFTVNLTTGVVTFTAAPAVGAMVSAGFEFDVPVRFENSDLPMNFATFDADQFDNVPLIETPLKIDPTDQARTQAMVDSIGVVNIAKGIW